LRIMVMYAKVGCAKCTFKTILANHAQKLRYIFDLIFRLRILDYTFALLNYTFALLN
jgi:hypothetical protein